MSVPTSVIIQFSGLLLALIGLSLLFGSIIPAFLGVGIFTFAWGCVLVNRESIIERRYR